MIYVLNLKLARQCQKQSELVRVKAGCAKQLGYIYLCYLFVKSSLVSVNQRVEY